MAITHTSLYTVHSFTIITIAAFYAGHVHFVIRNEVKTSYALPSLDYLVHVLKLFFKKGMT